MPCPYMWPYVNADWIYVADSQTESGSELYATELASALTGVQYCKVKMTAYGISQSYKQACKHQKSFVRE